MCVWFSDLVYTLPEGDFAFPDEVRVAGQEHLTRMKVSHEIKVYRGVPHGKLIHISLFPHCFL